MYTLRFPFGLPKNREIRVPLVAQHNNLSFLLNKQDTYYVLTIAGFPTEETAKRYINQIWAGLMWVLLHRGLPPDAIFELGRVAYPDNPSQAAKHYGFQEPIDGFIDGGQPTVYPTSKRIVTETALPITPLQSYDANDFMSFFLEGVNFSKSSDAINDAKLRVALELWGAFFTEVSGNAKFLTLIMALETLATGTPRTQLTLDLQDKWIKELEQLQKTITPDSDDSMSLEILKNDLKSRRENSLSRQIKNLVFQTLKANGDKDADAMEKKAGQVYAYRGTLVHTGKLEPPVLNQAITDAKNIVERILRARFIQTVNLDTDV